MTAKDFITNDKRISRKGIAKMIWPSNADAEAYLSRKLNGARPWTAADEKKALDVLAKLKLEIPSKD